MKSFSEADAYRLEMLARASQEAGTFIQLNRTIRSVNGLLELLNVTISQYSEGHIDCINWTVIAATVAVACDDMGPVYSAASLLEDLERSAAVIERQGGQP